MTRRDLEAALVRIRQPALGIAVGGMIAFWCFEISRWFGWPFGDIGLRDTAKYVLLGGMTVWLICRFAGDR
jgi:hypothetical protein